MASRHPWGRDTAHTTRLFVHSCSSRPARLLVHGTLQHCTMRRYTLACQRWLCYLHLSALGHGNAGNRGGWR